MEAGGPLADPIFPSARPIPETPVLTILHTMPDSEAESGKSKR